MILSSTELTLNVLTSKATYSLRYRYAALPVSSCRTPMLTMCSSVLPVGSPGKHNSPVPLMEVKVDQTSHLITALALRK